jgi:hypothetical protein
MPHSTVIRPFAAPLLLASALAFGVGRAAAQNGDGAAPEGTPTALASAKPAAAPSAAKDDQTRKSDDRQITDSDLAGALIDSLPKFDASKPNGNTAPAASTDDDKPKNGIVRLPKYVVTEKTPPVFTEKNSYSKEALEAIAVKRYLSDFDSHILNRWYIPFLTASSGERALQMYDEDERLTNMNNLNDEANAISRAGDPAEGDYIRKVTEDTYMRGIDWGWGAKGSLGLGADSGQ